jgi:uncharacterized Tic20 family protein
VERSPALSSDDRLFASLAHIGGLFGFGPIVAILILLLKGKESRYVWFQSAQSVAFDLVLYASGFLLGICWMFSFPLFAFGMSSENGTFPFAFMGIWGVAMVGMLLTVVFRIAAAISTFRGDNWRYPILADFIERSFPVRLPDST